MLNKNVYSNKRDKENKVKLTNHKTEKHATGLGLGDGTTLHRIPWIPNPIQKNIEKYPPNSLHVMLFVCNWSFLSTFKFAL